MVLANTLQESLGESPKTWLTNSSRPPANLKGKENPDLPSVCSNYWPPILALSLCYNHLVLSIFRQCMSAIPERSAKPIASIHHSVEYLWETPCLTCLCMQKQKYSVHVISWIFQVDLTTFVLFSYPVIASTFMKPIFGGFLPFETTVPAAVAG